MVDYFSQESDLWSQNYRFKGAAKQRENEQKREGRELKEGKERKTTPRDKFLVTYIN